MSDIDNIIEAATMTSDIVSTDRRIDIAEAFAIFATELGAIEHPELYPKLNEDNSDKRNRCLVKDIDDETEIPIMGTNPNNDIAQDLRALEADANEPPANDPIAELAYRAYTEIERLREHREKAEAALREADDLFHDMCPEVEPEVAEWRLRYGIDRINPI